MNRIKAYAVILMLVTCVTFSYASDRKDQKKMSNADIQRQLGRLWSVNEIQNLMGTYSFLHTSGRNFKAATELFTTYDDTVIEQLWGRYTGKDAAWRCYGIDQRPDDQVTIDTLHLSVPAVPLPPPPPGNGAVVPAGAATGGDSSARPPFYVHLQLLTTPVIQVAKDGETARGVWISPGIEGSGWNWLKYGADFKSRMANGRSGICTSMVCSQPLTTRAGQQRNVRLRQPPRR